MMLLRHVSLLFCGVFLNVAFGSASAPEPSSLMERFDNASKNVNSLFKFFRENPDFRIPNANPALFNAINNGNRHIAHLLIKRYDGLDHMFPGKDSAAMTAMHLAVEKGYTRILRRLIEFKADQGKQTEKGYTPLNYACSLALNQPELNDNLVDCVEVLLGTCQFVNTPTRDGFMPLHFAARNGSFGADLGELFFSKCGNQLKLDAKASLGATAQTPAEMAEASKNLEFSQLLNDNVEAKKRKLSVLPIVEQDDSWLWNIAIGLLALGMVAIVVVILMQLGIFGQKNGDTNNPPTVTSETLPA